MYYIKGIGTSINGENFEGMKVLKMSGIGRTFLDFSFLRPELNCFDWIFLE